MKELKFETRYKWGGECYTSCPLDKTEWRKVGSTYCEDKCPHNKGIDREKNIVLCDGVKEGKNFHPDSRLDETTEECVDCGGLIPKGTKICPGCSYRDFIECKLNYEDDARG